MEVIYSICSKLAGGGIGDTAYQAVRGIYRHAGDCPGEWENRDREEQGEEGLVSEENEVALHPGLAMVWFGESLF